MAGQPHIRLHGREGFMKFQSVTRAVLMSGIALGSVTTMAAPVWAQDEAAAEEADSSGEIIVTARRREESLIDVPISVTAISGDTLAAHGKACDITCSGTLIDGLVCHMEGSALVFSLMDSDATATLRTDGTLVLDMLGMMLMYFVPANL